MSRSRPSEQPAVRTTIVGGRPPGSGQPIGAIPRGLEVLVKKAAVDPAFRTLLLARRAKAARTIGLELSAAEKALLRSVTRAHLEQLIARTKVSPALHSVLQGAAAGLMIAALGFGTGNSRARAEEGMESAGARPVEVNPPAESREVNGLRATRPVEVNPPDEVRPTKGVRMDRPVQPPVQPASPPPKLSAEELRKQVEELAPKLSDKDFAVREEATKKLIALGKDVVPVLDGLKFTDPEAVARVGKVKEAFNPRPQVAQRPFQVVAVAGAMAIRPVQPSEPPSPPPEPVGSKLAPEELKKQVAALAPRLSDDEFTVREDATKKLLALGKNVVPVLEALNLKDPEALARVARIKDAFNPKPPPAQPPAEMQVVIGVRVLRE